MEVPTTPTQFFEPYSSPEEAEQARQEHEAAVALEGEVLPKVVGIGDKLANGATVLAVKPYTPAMGNTGVVFLALSHHDFVTWVGYPDGSETYWGHYFGVNLFAALADFEARS